MKRWAGFAILTAGIFVLTAASAAPRRQSESSQERSVGSETKSPVRYASAVKSQKSARKVSKAVTTKAPRSKTARSRAAQSKPAGSRLAHHVKSPAARVSVFNAGKPDTQVTPSRGIYRLGPSYVMRGQTYVPTHDPNYRAEGRASWYGSLFHGRRTANGERFDKDAVSAAHPTLPLPSYVRVTNLENNRSIVVRVNDRGPYHGGRLIDVSVRTAKLLGFYEQGLAHVRVEYLSRAGLDGSDRARLEKTLSRKSVPATLVAAK